MDPVLLDLPLTLKTPRLLLRPPQAGDGAAMLQTILDGYELQVQWLAKPPTPPSVQEVEKECRLHAAQWITREFLRFVVIAKESNEIIGRMGYPPNQLDWRIPYFGISYFVAKSHSRKGYCSEAVNAMTRFAFRKMRARKVQICCDTDNVASTKVPQKLQFGLEATQKGLWPRTDKKELATIQTYSVFSESELPPLEIEC